MKTALPPQKGRGSHAWSLRSQLVLLSLVVAAPLIGLAAYNMYSGFTEEKRRAGDQAVNIARSAAANVEHIVADARRILESLARRPAVRALDSKHCDPLLSEILSLHPRFANALVVDREGGLVCSSVDPRPGAPIRLDPANIFDKLRTSRQFTIGEPAKGSITGRWVVVLAQPLLDARGEFIGAVALPIDLLNSSLLSEGLALPEGAIAEVGTYAGTIVARTPDSEKFVGLSTKESKVRLAAVGAKTGHIEIAGMEGVKRVFGFTPIKGTGWYAVAGLPASQVYAASYARRTRGVVLVLISLLLISALASIFGRRIAQPIENIANAAGKISAGDLSVRAPLIGASEVKSLAGRFNAMLDSLVRLDADRACLLEIVERTSDLVVLAKPDRSLVYVNLAARELLGLRPGDSLENINTTRVYAPGDNEKVLQIARPHALAHGIWTGELLFLSHDGREVPVLHVLLALKDEHGELAYFAGISHDISERKLAENALRASEQRFRLAASSGQVWDWNIATDTFLFPAEFWSRLGYSRQDVGDQREKFESLIHPDDVDLWKRSVKDHVSRRIPYDLDFRMRAKSGEYRYFNTTGQAQWDAAGRATYMAGTTFDITERKHAEMALKDSANQLASLSHRLITVQEEERARIARELHDELGQALTAAKIRLQSGTAGANLPAVVAILDQALGQVRGLSLDLYPPQLDDLGLAAALRAHVTRSYGSATAKIEIASTPEVPSPPAGIALAAYRIAQEAIGNAVRHAGATRIQVSLAATVDAFVLTIADDGRGFDLRTARDRVQGGASLGLISMEERAKLAGGEVTIRSSPDSGATITARLPL